MEFVHSRTELQLQALEKAREEFSKYHVEVQGLLIAYINVDTQLLETQTKKEIAVQQQKQYEQEALAQEQRIAVAEKTARANQQENVISAKLSIEIAADRAEAMRAAKPRAYATPRRLRPTVLATRTSRSEPGWQLPTKRRPRYSDSRTLPPSSSSRRSPTAR